MSRNPFHPSPQRPRSEHRVIEVTDSARLGESLTGLRTRGSHMWTSLNGTSGRPESGWAFYVLLACTILLTGIGLMMVLSASAVEQITKDLDPLKLFTRQAMWALFGFAGLAFMCFLPRRWLQRAVWPLYFIVLALLAAVVFTPLGVNVGGNTNWLRLGGFTMQPSEMLKFVLALWTALFISRKIKRIGEFSQVVLPILVLGGIPIGLVLLGHDLGTAVILAAILLTSLLAAGAKGKHLLAVTGGAAVLVLIIAATNSNRTSRLAAWLGQDGACNTGLCDQADAGKQALASGGLFGVGLGESRMKWSWLPEAHNDFVFAIIGEEIGLFGTLFILLLFGIFILVSLRVLLRYEDVFIRVSGACIIVWLGFQAIVNIGMVTGLLPVIGVPLPLISYGGSALTFTLTAIGVLLSYARHKETTLPSLRRRKTPADD